MHYKVYGQIFDWIIRLSALIIFALGLLALIGWFSGRMILSSFRADYIPMAPNTALSFIFLSIALCLSLGSIQWRKRATIIISSVVGIIALLRMSEFLTGVDLQVDRWIFSYTGETLGLIPVGQMALPTAISFILISSSLILLVAVSKKEPKELSFGRNMLAGMLVLAPFAMGSAFLLGYIYGAPILYGSTKIPMAFSASIAMIASSIGVLSIILDNEFKLSLERKRIIEERDRMFNLSIDMLAIAGFDGYFKQLNPAWEKTLGWTKDELLSKPYIHFVHPDDIKSTIDAAKQLTAGKEVITFENRYRCSSGSYKWFSWSLSSLMEEKFIFAIGRDITDEKQLEGAKTLFLSMVSHELRTPLTPMQSQLELLINKKLPKRMQKESLNIVLRNVVRLNRLINDLLDITRLEAGRLKIRKSRESLSEVISQAAKMTSQSAKEKGMILKTDIRKLPSMEIDKDRITQVLINLLNNSIKYSKANAIEIKAEEKGKEVLVEIKDNGKGMPAEDTNRLFTPFFVSQAEYGSGGAGLGIYICKGIIELHNGRIWVESQVGKGTSFFFTLPVRAAKENK